MSWVQQSSDFLGVKRRRISEPPPVQIPGGLQVATSTAEEEVEEAQPISSPTLLDLLYVAPQFRGLNLLDLFRPREKCDWPDSNLLEKVAVKLYHAQDKELVENAYLFLTELTSGITQKTIARIFFLAWNLKSPTTRRQIFPPQSPTDTAEDKPIAAFSDMKICTGQTLTLGKLDYDPALYLPSVTYLAAYFLRLFRKSAENYLKAWNHIKQQFHKYYGFPFAINWFAPEEIVIKSIDTYFDHFTNSLCPFLYEHELTKRDKALRSMLYEQHLSCTGMHALTMFNEVTSTLNCDPQVLMSALHHYDTRAVDTIAQILKLYFSEPVDEKYKRHTWKYARIFDPSYFVNLQTKKCRELVVVLAQLTELTGAQRGSAGNVFSIAEIQQMNDKFVQIYKEHGTEIYRALTKQEDMNSASP